MKHLKTGDTGWYWCVVEIDRGTDISEYLYITVKGDPDLSVNESRVRGEEGGSVTVQCLYREAYQNKQKQWCRFKDTDCYTYKKKTPQNSAVQLSDDGKRSFSVEMRGLKKSDAGWYWCSVGDLQVPVHVNVSDPPPVLTTAGTSVTKEINTALTTTVTTAVTTVNTATKQATTYMNYFSPTAAHVTATFSSEKTI
ncbi:polymeric immunoglobulin receptor-like isoform 1-T1 [Clarias gariepinus]